MQDLKQGVHRCTRTKFSVSNLTFQVIVFGAVHYAWHGIMTLIIIIGINYGEAQSFWPNIKMCKTVD